MGAPHEGGPFQGAFRTHNYEFYKTSGKYEFSVRNSINFHETIDFLQGNQLISMNIHVFLRGNIFSMNILVLLREINNFPYIVDFL